MTAAPTPLRFDTAALQNFAQLLLQAAGMAADRAGDVADILVEGDLLGHDTHGLQLLPTYLAEIEAGGMALAGEPLLLADHGAGKSVV